MARSPETRAFIDEENAYTTRYLKQTRIRNQIVDDLDPLEHTTRWSIPIQRAGNYYFMKRLAGEEQASIYVRRGVTGAATKGPGNAAKDERLVDPASFSRDPNTSVRLADVSRDGVLVAYQVRQGGADEATVRIYSLTKKKSLEDELPAGVYYSIFFSPDGKGLYYARTDPKGTLLYLHTIGTRNSDDKLIFGREFHGELLGPIDLFNAEITDDGRYLVITIQRGVPPTRVDICFRDLKKPGSPFDVLVWGLDSRFSTIYFKGAWYVRTDYSSPNCRILRADPGIMPEAWKTIVPEGKDVIETSTLSAARLYVKRLHDVKSEISVYTLDGKAAGQVDLEGIGTASDIAGRTIDRYGFFSFESYIQPPTIYRIDTLTGKREPFAEPKTPFKTADYDLKQVFFKSTDGTQIPMFIAGKKGLKQDGSERLLMTGYGGFNLSETPAWNPAWAWWLQQGGWFAVPNLRGGGEYGESWHEQGMFEQKAECLRRLVRRSALPDRSEIHLAGALRHQRPLQRRPAHGRVHYPAPRALFRRLVRLSAARHASLSEIRARSPLDHRVRVGGEAKALHLSLQVLALSERQTALRLSCRHVLHWRQRYPRRSAARAQNDRASAIRIKERPPRSASLQHHRRPLRRRQRRAADPGRRRPTHFPLDRNRPPSKAKHAPTQRGDQP